MKRVALYARTSLGVAGGQTPETQLLAFSILGRSPRGRSRCRVRLPSQRKPCGSHGAPSAPQCRTSSRVRRRVDLGTRSVAPRRYRRDGRVPGEVQDGWRCREVTSASWLDTASPVNDLLLAVFAWVARQERERIRRGSGQGSLVRVRGVRPSTGHRRCRPRSAAPRSRAVGPGGRAPDRTLASDPDPAIQAGSKASSPGRRRGLGITRRGWVMPRGSEPTSSEPRARSSMRFGIAATMTMQSPR